MNKILYPLCGIQAFINYFLKGDKVDLVVCLIFLVLNEIEKMKGKMK